jgi:hypothetical protein
LDLGVGLPQIASVNGEAAFLDWLQFGFGFGTASNGMIGSPGIKLGNQQVTLVDGKNYTFQGQGNWSVATLSPFIRVFPVERNFYVQFTYALIRASATLNSDLVGNGVRVPNAVQANATLLQAIPTLAIGHIFASRLYFVNLSLGLSMIGNTNVSVAVTNNIPSSLGGPTANQSAFNGSASKITNDATKASNDLKSKALLLPSLYLGVGFLL